MWQPLLRTRCVSASVGQGPRLCSQTSTGSGNMLADLLMVVTGQLVTEMLPGNERSMQAPSRGKLQAQPVPGTHSALVTCWCDTEWYRDCPPSPTSSPGLSAAALPSLLACRQATWLVLANGKWVEVMWVTSDLRQLSSKHIFSILSFPCNWPPRRMRPQTRRGHVRSVNVYMELNSIGLHCYGWEISIYHIKPLMWEGSLLLQLASPDWYR